ncbi:MAG: hypothetical protein H6Q90_2274 [Deltaproteobacteria bacterium]|nr:hypothetical protein [Deltaproteobacteria bacterium]
MTARSEADPEFLVLYGGIDGGGMLGKGTGGDQKDAAFFATSSHGTYGATVGARILFLGAAIEHHQYVGSGLSTWTQISGGLDMNVGLGSDKEKKAGKGGFFHLGATAGFGVGTGQQVDPPLSNDEVTDKGFLLTGTLGFGKHFNKMVDLGVSLPVTWGYYFKNGVAANDVSNHYQGIHGEALLYLRLNLKLL